MLEFSALEIDCPSSLIIANDLSGNHSCLCTCHVPSLIITSELSGNHSCVCICHLVNKAKFRALFDSK